MAALAAGRRVPILLACALAVLGLQGSAPAQGRRARDAPALMPFQGSLSEARALAADRNVPLLVVTIYEDEAWDPKDHHDQVDMRRAVLEDRALASVLERAVVTLACNAVHEIEEVEVGQGDARRTVRRCSSYRTDSCAVHQRLFGDVYAAWNEDGSTFGEAPVLLPTTRWTR